MMHGQKTIKFSKYAPPKRLHLADIQNGVLSQNTVTFFADYIQGVSELQTLDFFYKSNKCRVDVTGNFVE
jgi:hypothetical protein